MGPRQLHARARACAHAAALGGHHGRSSGTVRGASGTGACALDRGRCLATSMRGGKGSAQQNDLLRPRLSARAPCNYIEANSGWPSGAAQSMVASVVAGPAGGVAAEAWAWAVIESERGHSSQQRRLVLRERHAPRAPAAVAGGGGRRRRAFCCTCRQRGRKRGMVVGAGRVSPPQRAQTRAGGSPRGRLHMQPRPRQASACRATPAGGASHWSLTKTLLLVRYMQHQRAAA